MRVLVTGGAGFIGRHLVQALLGDGHTVRVLDSLSPQVHGPEPRFPIELEHAEAIQGDVRDPDTVSLALADVEAVVHLAAETGVGQSMYEIARYVDVNDRGTACLLDGLVRRQLAIPIVLASSRAVYGEGLYHCPQCGEVSPRAREAAALERGTWDPLCPICAGDITSVPTHEGAPPRPGSVYAATKLAQEHLCQIVADAYGMPLTILRFFNVYGPGQSLSNPYTGILSTFYTRASSGKAIAVFEDGEESRDFVYVGDVVEAIRRSLGHSTRPGHQTLNVGSGTAVSVADLARTMLQLGGWNVPIQVTGAWRAGDIRHAIADVRRSAQALGMTTPTALEAGLRLWLEWASREAHRDMSDEAMGQLTERGLYRQVSSR
jgi:dTDP-L-rhamnose 4-epimerase